MKRAQKNAGAFEGEITWERALILARFFWGPPKLNLVQILNDAYEKAYPRQAKDKKDSPE